MITLENTNAAAIAAALVDARRSAGSPAMGMVMTLVLVVAEDEADDALEAARHASREHPARLLGVILGTARGRSSVSAEIRTGMGQGSAGEMALIRLEGEVTKHPESVVLPLLLPDSPVVVWWPSDAPADPAADPIGRLGQRRITDAASVPTNKARAMLTQCHAYAPGNTDLAWTRVTAWRALLAAALDQNPGKVTAASVTAERISPSADLLSAWLSDRLKVPVKRGRSDGPGITSVVLSTKNGDVEVSRPDGRLATLKAPAQPDRPVALKRREVPELLAEELRRLDPDDVYAATVKRLASLSKQPKQSKPSKRSTPSRRSEPATTAEAPTRSSRRRPAARRPSESAGSAAAATRSADE